MSGTPKGKTNGADGATLHERARLSFDLDVDICVVGAGLAGLTVALEAARLGASVAVLEGRHVGWNASGHQLGTVMPGYSLPIGDLIERVGLEDARELWAMSKEGADYVRAAATEEAMPGIALTEGALEVSNVDAGETLISRLQTLSEDFETEVEGWQVDRVRDQLGTARYFHGIYYPRAFQIDGRKYIHGLAAQARRAGARIFEDTPVVSIDPSGIRKRIVTPSARLRASHLVLAGNVHLGAPLRRLSDTLLPVWRHAAVAEALRGPVGDVVALQGLNTSAMAGQVIARSILWGEERWKLSSPFELVWAGGATGRVAGHLIGLWGRGHSAAAGALARYREGARARERVREARLAEANRQAGTRPPRGPPGGPRPVRPQPPRPVAGQDGGI